MKKKKIDWFFMIFLFFALVILVVFACFVNKKLIYINKNLDITNNKNKIEEKVDKIYLKKDYLLFLNNLESELGAALIEKEDNEKKVFINKIEHDIFSIKVPEEYKDFHLQLALFFTKLKIDLSDNQNKELFFEYLNDFINRN